MPALVLNCCCAYIFQRVIHDRVGAKEGTADGLRVGNIVGLTVGAVECVGASVGYRVMVGTGAFVGDREGEAVGLTEGEVVG